MQYFGPAHLKRLSEEHEGKDSKESACDEKKAVSKIARGKLAKVAVFKGTKARDWCQKQIF